jgi:hypothetical protein
MLAHKLADYYGLEHAVQSSSTGAAVLITKSSFLRMYEVSRTRQKKRRIRANLSSPPPLSGISHPSTQSSTPPPIVPARKIMRRGGENNGASNGNSEGPSKAGSEDGSDPDQGTPNGSKKGPLTREEREAKYAAARLRIFGDKEEAEMTDASKEGADKDISRTSSASGKKKPTKKQRNESNDDFEPRSQFPGYYANQYAANGYGPEAYVYPSFGGMVAYNMPQNGPPPQVMYPAGYAQVDAQGQYAYLAPQSYPVSPNGMGVPTYGQPGAAGYDLSAHFQQGMQFTGAGAPQVSQMAPKPAPSSYPAQFQMATQQMPGQPWQQPSYEPSSQYPQASYVPVFPPERPMSSPGQASPPAPHYHFGQLPSSGYPNGRPPKHQHPVPGSYNRQQFNPQTQAFVPGSGRSSGQMVSIGGPGAMYNSFQTMPNHIQSMQPRSTPPTSNPSAYSSPRAQAISMAGQNNGGGLHGMSYANASYSAPPSAPPTSNNVHNNNHAHASLPAHPPSSQHHQTQQLNHPLPQPPNPASSIAKWGTPAHLPPKPPPPQDMHPQKFIEINRGSLPPHAQIPGLPKSAFIPGSGPLNGHGVNGNQGHGK